MNEERFFRFSLGKGVTMFECKSSFRFGLGSGYGSPVFWESVERRREVEDMDRIRSEGMLGREYVDAGLGRGLTRLAYMTRNPEEKKSE